MVRYRDVGWTPSQKADGMSQTHGAASITPAVDRAQAEEDLTLASLLEFVLRHRRLILGTGLIAFGERVSSTPRLVHRS
jgi:hypothetical protein